MPIHLLRDRHPTFDQMIALIYETVPAFEDTWIECLGDLGRYRMAIEDGLLSAAFVYQERATPAQVSRSRTSSTVGRFYQSFGYSGTTTFSFPMRQILIVQPCVKVVFSAGVALLHSQCLHMDLLGMTVSTSTVAT